LFCYGLPFIPHKNRPEVIFWFSSYQFPQFLVEILRKNEELNNHYAVYVGDASGCIPGGEIPLHFLNYNLTGFRDPHCFWKLDPVPDLSSGACEAQNGTLEGRGRSKWRRGGSIWKPGGSVGQGSQICIPLLRSRIRIRIEVKSWIWIRIKRKSWIRMRSRIEVM
jgi:hypothetical protein